MVVLVEYAAGDCFVVLTDERFLPSHKDSSVSARRIGSDTGGGQRMFGLWNARLRGEKKGAAGGACPLP